MAEALGLGANVVAFIGLAGQVTQGCQYIKTILDDVKDAPDDIRCLNTEINLLIRTLESFKNTLTELSHSRNHAGIGGESKLALDYCEEAMAGLLKSVLKIKRPGSKLGHVRFAFSKDKISKHTGRVERAKGYVATAQASILLSLEGQRTLDTKITHQSLSSLSSELNASSTIISTLPARLDEVDQKTLQTHQFVTQMNSDLAARIHDLSTGINKILSNDFSASMTLISHSHSHVDEVLHDAKQTQAAMDSLGTTSDGLKGLPSGMLNMVKDTFRGSLVEFHFETSQFRNLQETAQGGSASYSGSAQAVDMGLIKQSPRTVLNQYTHVRKYIRAIGIITVYSTTTTFRDRDPQTGTPTTSTVTQTHVELFPNPEFLYVGVYCSFVLQGFATFPARIEPKLRVYHVVDSSAPIIRACANGDLQTVQRLFVNGEASPFDRMWRETSLLDLVMFRIVLSAKGGLPRAQMPKLLELFKELVGYGLDPGMVRMFDIFTSNGRLPLFALSGLIDSCPRDLEPYLIDLGRIIITKSVNDPLFNTTEDTPPTYRDPFEATPQIVPILLAQEEWPITLEPVDRSSIEMCTKKGTPLLEYGIYQGSRLFYYESNPFCHDPHEEVLRETLQGRSLDEKLSILEHMFLSRVIDGYTGLSADEENDIVLERRIVTCLTHCIPSGFDPLEPPLQFYPIIERFRKNHRLDPLRSALLQISLEENAIEELFEANNYASLAYQLENITDSGSRSFPMEIQYQEINLDTWYEFLTILDEKKSPKPTQKQRCQRATGTTDKSTVDDCAPLEESELRYRQGSIPGAGNDATLTITAKLAKASEDDTAAENEPDSQERTGSPDSRADCSWPTSPEFDADDDSQPDSILEWPLETTGEESAFDDPSNKPFFSEHDAPAVANPSSLTEPKDGSDRDAEEDNLDFREDKGQSIQMAREVDGGSDSDDGRIEGIAVALSAFWT